MRTATCRPDTGVNAERAYLYPRLYFLYSEQSRKILLRSLTNGLPTALCYYIHIQCLPIKPHSTTTWPDKMP